MNGLSSVDLGGVPTPFHLKIRSSDLQSGLKGDGLSLILFVSEIDMPTGIEGANGAAKTGATQATANRLNAKAVSK